MTAGLLLAFLSDIREVILFALRLLLALFGAWLGWLLARPVARGLCRLAFQRQIPDTALTFSRLAGALGAGVLVFVLFQLAVGPGGDGNGDGKSKGKGDGDGKVAKTDGEGGKGGQDGRLPTPQSVVKVEMIPSKRYAKDQRWYLIEGKEPPKTLEEVKEYLGKYKERVDLEVVVFPKTTVDHGHYAVKALQELAQSEESKLRFIPRTGREDKKRTDKE